MEAEKFYNIWAKRNPKWETRFEKIIQQFTDYGIGASESTEAKGKTFGAGYEMYIYAFFVGLYAKRRRKLDGETKVFGHSIQNWGNFETRKFRKAYPRLREYLFTALIAKTDLDLIALEKGDIADSKVVDMLKDTMEQYANYGFYAIENKMKENPNYFYKTTGFLDLILDLVIPKSNSTDTEIEEL